MRYKDIDNCVYLISKCNLAQQSHERSELSAALPPSIKKTAIMIKIKTKIKTKIE